MSKSTKAFLACVATYIMIYIVVSITETILWEVLL